MFDKESGQTPKVLKKIFDSDCSKEVVALQRSPCFAMSRGGKELFHTNFLSFLLEVDLGLIEDKRERGVVSAVQKALIKLIFSAGGEVVDLPNSVQTWRENRSLDLVVLAAPTVTENKFPGFEGCAPMVPGTSDTFAASRELLGLVGVVIEAKFKALPTRAQLLKYDKRLTDGVRFELAETKPVKDEADWGWLDMKLISDQHSAAILKARYASVHGADPEVGQQKLRNISVFACGKGSVLRVLLAPAATVPEWLNETSWKLLSWEKLIETMNDAMPPVNAPSLRDAGLIILLRDYVTFTDHLLNLIKMTANGVVAFSQSSSLFSELAGVHEKFAQLRIHDLIGKVAFDRLRELLCTGPLKANAERSLPNGFAFNNETFLSRGTPGLIIEFVYTNSDAKQADRNFSLGIQIQGTKYRHYVSVSKPKPEGGGLLEFAMLMGQPNAESEDDKGWWNVNTEPPEASQGKKAKGRSKSDEIAKAGFRRFGAEAFLYTQTDIAGLCYSDLVKKVGSSMAFAARVLQKNHIVAGAEKFVGTPDALTKP